MSERLCLGCRTWYDAKEAACPMCGQAPSRPNSHLYSAKLNSHMNQQAERARGS